MTFSTFCYSKVINSLSDICRETPLPVRILWSHFPFSEIHVLHPETKHTRLEHCWPWQRLQFLTPGNTHAGYSPILKLGKINLLPCLKIEKINPGFGIFIHSNDPVFFVVWIVGIPNIPAGLPFFFLLTCFKIATYQILKFGSFISQVKKMLSGKIKKLIGLEALTHLLQLAAQRH